MKKKTIYIIGGLVLTGAVVSLYLYSRRKKNQKEALLKSEEQSLLKAMGLDEDGEPKVERPRLKANVAKR